jgi:hypothetical protein
VAAAAILDAFRSYLQALGDSHPAEFISGIDWRMPARQLTPNGLACLRHLDRAVEIAHGPERSLVTLLAEGRASLHWGQTYTADDFGEHFIDNYGWLELFGTRGHFDNNQIAAGFLILGPDILYPDHHHIAEELYVPLTGGSEWRKGEGGFVQRQASAVIHHPSDVNHAMRTGREPLVALYIWRGGPLAQKSTITG